MSWLPYGTVSPPFLKRCTSTNKGGQTVHLITHTLTASFTWLQKKTPVVKTGEYVKAFPKPILVSTDSSPTSNGVLWKVFTELDTQDEADMIALAGFFQVLSGMWFSLMSIYNSRRTQLRAFHPQQRVPLSRQ